MVMVWWSTHTNGRLGREIMSLSWNIKAGTSLHLILLVSFVWFIISHCLLTRHTTTQQPNYYESAPSASRQHQIHHGTEFVESSPLQGASHNNDNQQEVRRQLNLNGKELPRYEQIIGRIDKWTTARQSPDSAVLTVVSHRELLIGCLSFEEYLSTKYHTIFVLPKDYALALSVDKLVEQATPDQTAGAHLFFVAGSIAGEMLARRIGEEFARRELEPLGHKIDFLNSFACDVHQLPTKHDMFMSIEDITLQLERDFRLARQRRQLGDDIVSNYDEAGNALDAKSIRKFQLTHDVEMQMPQREMKIFAMNTNLYEQLPDLHSVSSFHGADIFRWYKEGGSKNKPQELVDANVPWLSDVSIWVECHQLMFDLEVFRSIQSMYLSIKDTFPNESSWIGPFANKYNLTILRHNDLFFHLDFGEPREGYVTHSFPPHVDMDFVRVKNFELLGRTRNPKHQYELFHMLHDSSGVTPNRVSFFFLFQHYHKFWEPTSFAEGKPLDQNTNALKFLENILHYFGYRFNGLGANDDGLLHYELEGVFPANLVVKTLDGGGDTADNQDCKEFFAVATDRNNRLVLCISKYTMSEQEKFSKEQRSVTIPINATIDKIWTLYRIVKTHYGSRQQYFDARNIAFTKQE